MQSASFVFIKVVRKRQCPRLETKVGGNAPPKLPAGQHSAQCSIHEERNMTFPQPLKKKKKKKDFGD